jgi:hypothetical protein
MAWVLSEKRGVGAVVVCGRCEDVHLSCGNLNLRLPKDVFLAVANMVRTAAEALAAESPRPGEPITFVLPAGRHLH